MGWHMGYHGIRNWNPGKHKKTWRNTPAIFFGMRGETAKWSKFQLSPRNDSGKTEDSKTHHFALAQSSFWVKKGWQKSKKRHLFLLRNRVTGDRQICFGLSPLPVTVTARIITFLVGDPELNLHLPLLLGRGTTQDMFILHVPSISKSLIRQICPKTLKLRIDWITE